MTATNGPTADDVVAGLDLSDRTVLVTGATSGIGRETARALASAGARVLLAGRGADRLAAARAGLLDAAPAADLSTLELDLASLAGVRAAAERVMDEVARLDALVNNAGVMFTPFGRTPDGFETQIGVNHLGHFLLTRLLDPLLGEGSRVVTVSSAGHKLADVDLADLSWRHRRYDKFAAYGASKTANILFTVALEAGLRERGAHAFAVHPGTVATDLARHMDRADFAELGRLAAAASSVGSSTGSAAGTSAEPTTGRADPAAQPMRVVGVDQGAATSVWAVTSPVLAGRGGLYLADCAVSDDVRPYATDPDRARLLWELSERLVGLG